MHAPGAALHLAGADVLDARIIPDRLRGAGHGRSSVPNDSSSFHDRGPLHVRLAADLDYLPAHHGTSGAMNPHHGSRRSNASRHASVRATCSRPSAVTHGRNGPCFAANADRWPCNWTREMVGIPCWTVIITAFPCPGVATCRPEHAESTRNP